MTRNDESGASKIAKIDNVTSGRFCECRKKMYADCEAV